MVVGQLTVYLSMIARYVSDACPIDHNQLSYLGAEP
jgi:hypothetical protein